jgi:hypothetical protein
MTSLKSPMRYKLIQDGGQQVKIFQEIIKLCKIGKGD